MQTLKNKVNEFQALLEAKSLKYTYERKMILEEVAGLKEHFDADSLYDRFKKKGMRILPGRLVGQKL